MTARPSALSELERLHPEWEPWLAVITEVVREAGDPGWDVGVPVIPQGRTGPAPLLAGMTLALEKDAVRRVLNRIILIAQRSGTLPMASLGRASHADFDVVELFTASLEQDDARLSATAAAARVDAGALQAIAALLPVPFLQACHRRCTRSLANTWTEGYCPLCGAWPTLAEVRGIERSRYLRCGRCGSQWLSQVLCCPYCGMTDHEELASLLPDKRGTTGMIEACRRCRGYVKTFTRLQGSAPAHVLIDDLASVDLDVAALEHGYERPRGGGHPLGVIVV